MSLKQFIPSPESDPSLVEKLKKAFLYLLLAASSSWGLLAPAAASAGFFSISSLLQSITPQAQAASATQNSQTVDILASATNIDPSPSDDSDVSVVGDSALVPQDGPSGTPADAGAKPSSYDISVYTVHDGDTLSGIASMFGVSVGTITGANDLQGKSIHAGDELIILPIATSEYTVKPGDTISGIAKATGSDAFDIQQYNDLGSDADLIAGSTILIPNAEAEAPAPAVAQSSPASSKTPAKTAATTPAKKATTATKTTTGTKVTKTSTVTPASAKVLHAAAGSTEPYLGGSGPALPGYFEWPLQGGIITQGLHGYNAVDIGAPKGTPIYAAASGTVIIALQNGGYNGGYGNYVVIKHPNGTQTLYAHMSKVLTTVGATVAQGQTIGQVGMTGLATGNHLHFEVRGAANPFAN